MSRVEFINPVFEGDLCGRWRHSPVVEAGAAETEQLGLHNQREVNRFALNERQPVSA